MKKLLLLTMAVLTLSLSARAADGDTFTVDGFRFSIISEADHTVSIARNGLPAGELKIPSSVTISGTRYSVTEIHGYGFSGCTDLTSIVIPNSVIIINNGAFNYCDHVTTLTIPSSVIAIGTASLAQCYSLKEIYLYPTTPPGVGANPFYDDPKDVIVYIPKGTLEAYTNSAWNYFTDFREMESGIDDVETDAEEGPAEYYNLNGMRVSGDALAPGIYIKRQGGKASKVLVK